MKFHKINHDRVVCNYNQIHSDRYTALAIASKFGGELLELWSNAIVFNTTDTKALELKLKA